MQNANSGNIANQVKDSLTVPDSGNLIDFIKGNLKPVTPEPAQILDAAKVAADAIVNSSEKVTEIKAPDKPIDNPAVNSTSDLKVNPVPSEPSEDVQDLLNLDDKDKSWKGLRQQVTRSKNRVEELERVVQEKEQYVEKILKGEEEIEPIKILKEENQKLTKYRDMYDLETSPDYIRTYVEPVNAAKEKLKSYAAEYEVPIEHLEALIDTPSDSKINKFLSEHFDAIGGVEVKNIISDVKQKLSGRTQALESPKQTLERLRSDAVEASRHLETERISKINSTATSSYNLVSKVLKDMGKYPELVKRGDPEHDSYVDMVEQNIARSYGETIADLGNAGLKELPESLAQRIFAQVALSEITNFTAESRARLFEENQKIIGDTRRRARFESPPLGGVTRSSGGGNTPQSKGPDSPIAAGQEILNRIGVRG